MSFTSSLFVQATGEYAENGHNRTVAVAIGRELGTVGPELIREAAKEAVKIADLLVVCGFAFDLLAGEEASTLGRLTILQARMNPDLAMGDELLKKTGSGNCSWSSASPTSRSKRLTTAS
jgi:adenine-specific DNA-methyltransferase